MSQKGQRVRCIGFVRAACVLKNIYTHSLSLSLGPIRPVPYIIIITSGGNAGLLLKLPRTAVQKLHYLVARLIRKLPIYVQFRGFVSLTLLGETQYLYTKRVVKLEQDNHKAQVFYC
jgi:hypothetical protein